MTTRRVVPIAILLAGAGAAALLFPTIPHEHHVSLRLVEPASVTGVQLAWLAADSLDAVHAISLRYEPGQAPRTVETRVSLPHGRYDLQILVERATEHEEFRRTIELGDADAITVPLR